MAANVVKNQTGIPENLSKQLAVAVRSIQWSYAIFWSLSATQQGELQWGNGYYNGDIKTRKTVQTSELKADKIGLQRSEQLRELYESLLETETDQTRRPCASLSPEDLSDTEWYYLVCMSFVFNTGQGLPGKAFASDETIWLCNAQYADSKIFSRSLLAKSASIQTVVCFPYLGGVIELGVTELVPEDPNLLQHIKASLLDFSKPDCLEKSSSAPHNADDDKDPTCTEFNHGIVDLLELENLNSPTKEIEFDHEEFDEDFDIGSPNECSNDCEQNHQMDDSFMLEDVNGVASQVQSWHFMDDDDDDDFSIQEKTESYSRFNELHEGDRTIISSSGLEVDDDDDLHYKKIVSAVLRTSNWLIESPGFRTCGNKSSFISWKKGGITKFHSPRVQQNIFKKILFTVPLMHRSSSLTYRKQNDDDVVVVGSVLPEKRKEDEKFRVLRSMVPSISEIDKESILKDTIEYLKELEARIEELESCKNSSEFEARPRRICLEVVEQTSDNYENRKVDDAIKKPWINKRKACDVDESHHESGSKSKRVLQEDFITTPDVKVSVKNLEVVIEIRCPFREFLLLDIMEAINNLHLDVHTVQSSTLDGLVTLTLKSKFRGAAVAPAVMIKQALQRVATK